MATGEHAERPRDEQCTRGQASPEYAGLVLLVAAIIVALGVSGLGGMLAAQVERGLRCVVAVGGLGRCVPAGEATGGEATQAARARAARALTPLERATHGAYVALGDSYSSGEGGTRFLPGTDQDVSAWESFKEVVDGIVPFWDYELPTGRNMCHRSMRAYSARVYHALDFRGDFTFHACTGRSVDDLDVSQLAELNAETSLVTLSVGGNDAGFADVLKACYISGLMRWQGGCRASMGMVTRERISGLEDDLVRLYRELQRHAPNARIVVVGYPRMFPERPTEFGAFLEFGDVDEPVSPADQRWMNEMALLLSRTIKNAAGEAGVEFVDVYDALDGHEIGTARSWINDLNPELENGRPYDLGSFHPNDSGQAAIARLVERHIRAGGAG